MPSEKEMSKIIKILKNHEKRITALEGKKAVKVISKTNTWYKHGSTIEKIKSLIDEGFFNAPQTISEIISELKTKDYHLKASDLTLPLRKIVRKGLLKKIKRNVNGSPSKKWLYIKV
ncbi:MAG TPA: hypothetical protein VF399_08230 [bacterium]